MIPKGPARDDPARDDAEINPNGGRPKPVCLWPLLAAAGEAIDLALHIVELAFQIVDIARLSSSFLGFTAFAATLASGKRREHGKGALKHIHVAPSLLFQRRERADAEGLCHLL